MNKRRVNVRAVVWKDNKILAVKHKSENGDEAEYWALPGGGLDPGETLTDGIARELMEETGIEAEIGRLLFIQQFPSTRLGYDEEVEFLYNVENPDDFVNIDLSTTTHGAQELARIEFIDPQKEYLLPAFLTTIDIKSYVVDIKPVYLYSGLNEPGA